MGYIFLVRQICEAVNAFVSMLQTGRDVATAAIQVLVRKIPIGEKKTQPVMD